MCPRQFEDNVAHAGLIRLPDDTTKQIFLTSSRNLGHDVRAGHKRPSHFFPAQLGRISGPCQNTFQNAGEIPLIVGETGVAWLAAVHNRQVGGQTENRAGFSRVRDHWSLVGHRSRRRNHSVAHPRKVSSGPYQCSRTWYFGLLEALQATELIVFSLRSITPGLLISHSQITITPPALLSEALAGHDCIPRDRSTGISAPKNPRGFWGNSRIDISRGDASNNREPE